MNCRIAWYIIGWALGLLPATGCYRSSSDSDDVDSGTGGDAAEILHDTVRPEADVQAEPPPEIVPEVIPDPPLPDAAPDVEPSCIGDEDCTIVILQDRCCSPDPVAIPRALVGSDPCFHEFGVPWADNPACPDVECFWCPPISTRAYGARCVDGQCVPAEDFCSSAMPAPVGAFYAYIEPTGGWEQYRGQVVEITDNPELGPRSCDCGTYGDCDCVELPVQQTLDCEITLRGSVCGERWECTGTECSPSCSPRRIRNQTSFVGYLVDSVADGLELWVMSGYEDCPPPGLNEEGEPCTPFGNDDCLEGLICFYWGDVLEDCIGTCRPFGTECVTETECDSGEVCYNGYCMWCCPG